MKIPYYLSTGSTAICGIMAFTSVLAGHGGHAVLCAVGTLVSLAVTLNMNEQQEPNEPEEPEDKLAETPESENPRHRMFEELEQSGVI